ncbi:phospholipase C [Thermomonospora echinospora]|uniref:phospholipase C n=1 Tax=Thermomonospora echinospora TaxID=1992 RepID=A0A1H6CCM7_9ACTN|nr:alkaline phosphatase family protein [Thermomonospora echinospora]SEG70126.1 phospholipase C [Thermomonospora echinospora]
MPYSRRTFLAGAAAAVGVTMAGGVTYTGAGPQIGTEPQALAGPPPSGKPGIDHIVVVMMENRSFDHFLGWLPNANGKQDGLTFVDREGEEHSTRHLRDFQGCGHPDPNHSFRGGRIQYNDGANDGWLRAPRSDEFAIGYYLAEDLDFYRHAAPYWTVCDNYFAAFMGPTYPNRLYQHAARTDRIRNSHRIPEMPTIWDRLAEAGLRGRYYYSDLPFTALWGKKYRSISHPYPQFLDDCAKGDLPELSFVDPKFSGEANGTSADDHPHADIRAGQYFLNQVYRAVTRSPAWGRTMLVINYDEWGGFFDHVPPSVAPDAHPSWGLRGFRVPCLVISPWARRGHVASGLYDHTSVLKAVESRWGLEPLSPRDAAARDIAEVLDFTRPPMLTPPQWEVPKVVGRPCNCNPAKDDCREPWRGLRDLADVHDWELDLD